MARKSPPTYPIEFALHIPTWQKHRLEKKFKIARTVYNSCLGEALIYATHNGITSLNCITVKFRD